MKVFNFDGTMLIYRSKNKRSIFFEQTNNRRIPGNLYPEASKGRKSEIEFSFETVASVQAVIKELEILRDNFNVASEEPS
jgi:hypothetical protein